MKDLAKFGVEDCGFRVCPPVKKKISPRFWKHLKEQTEQQMATDKATKRSSERNKPRRFMAEVIPSCKTRESFGNDSSGPFI